MLERRGWPFIARQENLAIGVSKIRTCLGRGPDMSGQPLWNPAWGSDMSVLELSRWGNWLGRTCPGWGPNMSCQPLWNPAWGLDMSG
jgi:hypothetical protein